MGEKPCRRKEGNSAFTLCPLSKFSSPKFPHTNPTLPISLPLFLKSHRENPEKLCQGECGQKKVGFTVQWELTPKKRAPLLRRMSYLLQSI